MLNIVSKKIVKKHSDLGLDPKPNVSQELKGTAMNECVLKASAGTKLENKIRDLSEGSIKPKLPVESFSVLFATACAIFLLASAEKRY